MSPWMDRRRRAIEELASAIRPLLAGHPPEVQSGALGVLMSVYLAGFHVPASREKERELRRDLFEAWRDMVFNLVKAEDEKP
jgi:hypothetical protein